MIIDWHAHIYTPEEAADDIRTYDGKSGPSWGERGCPMVLDNFLDAHYKAGIDISVVTNAAHYLRGKSAGEELPATTPPKCRRNTRERSTALPPSCRAADRPFSRRPSGRCGSSASRAYSFIPVTRAIIRTTTKRGHSGSWLRISMFR